MPNPCASVRAERGTHRGSSTPGTVLLRSADRSGRIAAITGGVARLLQARARQLTSQAPREGAVVAAVPPVGSGPLPARPARPRRGRALGALAQALTAPPPPRGGRAA